MRFVRQVERPKRRLAQTRHSLPEALAGLLEQKQERWRLVRGCLDILEDNSSPVEVASLDRAADSRMAEADRMRLAGTEQRE